MANLWSARKSACHTRKVAYAGQRRLTGARSHSTSALGKNGHRPFVAGCVRSRTAASEQRNSWNPCVPDRQLCGSCYDRFGSAAVRRVWQLNGRLQTQAVCQTVKYRTSGTTDRRRQKTVAQPLRRSVRARPGADLRASEMDAVEETFDPQKRAHTA